MKFKYRRNTILFHKHLKVFWRIIDKKRTSWYLSPHSYKIQLITKRTNEGKITQELSEKDIDNNFLIVENLETFKILYGV